MAYKDAVNETAFAKVSVHNKAELAPDHAWIVSEKQDRDTLSFFKNSSPAEIKGVFQTVASLEDDGGGKFILFHAVNPGDSVQHTNSKLPSLHIHTFTGPFAAEFSHIADPAVKSYTVQPNASLAATIQSAAVDAPAQDGFKTVTLSKDQGGEIASHTILTHEGFASFGDFAQNAADSDWENFRQNMVRIIEPAVQKGAGGARVIIDDRYLNTGSFTVQVLAGENMDRSGQNKQRYFERPSL